MCFPIADTRIPDENVVVKKAYIVPMSCIAHAFRVHWNICPFVSTFLHLVSYHSLFLNVLIHICILCKLLKQHPYTTNQIVASE